MEGRQPATDHSELRRRSERPASLYGQRGDQALDKGDPDERARCEDVRLARWSMQALGVPEEDPTGGFTHGGWSVNHWDDEMMGRMAEAAPNE
jgi:hypothetical protein